MMLFPSLLIDISSWPQRMIIGLSALVGNPSLRHDARRQYQPYLADQTRACAFLALNKHIEGGSNSARFEGQSGLGSVMTQSHAMAAFLMANATGVPHRPKLEWR
jgi:hypothetical protein